MSKGLQLVSTVVVTMVIAIACGASERSAPQPQQPAQSGPPNIILIQADDLGFGDLSAYGQGKFATPGIDRLATEGIRFTNYYSGSTVCAPSRAALMTGMRDPYSDVRNNAMRALGILARVPVTVRLTRKIPYDGFIALLGSLVWTDRNKASLALSGLTAERPSVLLEQIWREALRPLVDMARWKSLGHATPALEILMRIAALPDDSVAKATTPAAREEIIQAALGRRQ